MAASTASRTIDHLKDLISLEAIGKALDDVSKKEDEVDKRLKKVLSGRDNLQEKVAALNKILPNVDLIHGDASQLSSMVNFTSSLASNVSEKVRKLDMAKSRASACLQRANDIIDLKTCTDGVERALIEEDYEQAAAHIHRYLSLDKAVLKLSSDANEGGSLDQAFAKLHNAELKLKKIANEKFDKAVVTGDLPSAQRFFKIFPLLNLHDTGLSKYSKYLCGDICEKVEKHWKTALAMNEKRATSIYPDSLTFLFETVAQAVEIHQPIVENYYGFGSMLTLIKELQKECDRQVVTILEHFKTNRQYAMKAQQIGQLLMNQKVNTERIDPKELDTLLIEVTLIHARSELYLRFIRKRIIADLESSEAFKKKDANARQEQLKEVEQFLNTCRLSKHVQELLSAYITLEEYFMRESVTKAVQIETWDPEAQTSSVVDDVFFVIRKCIRRALSSSYVDGVCAMINHSCHVLESDFKEILYGKLKSGFPIGFDLGQAYNLIQSSLQQGRLQSSDTEKAKAAFLVALNNAETSVRFVHTLKKSLEEEIPRMLTNMSDKNKAKIDSCLADLGSCADKFNNVLEYGFNQLVSSALKPRIRQWVDYILSSSYNLTEDEFAINEANDPFIEKLICNLGGLMSSFKPYLTEGNFDRLGNVVAVEVSARLEKAVLKMTFNRLGGLQLDKELRSLTSYLTSVTTWSIRDKFARLSQISTILNLDSVNEINEYWGTNSGPITWRLTPSEVRQVLSLRVEFKSEDIRKLKL